MLLLMLKLDETFDVWHETKKVINEKIKAFYNKLVFKIRDGLKSSKN